MTLCKTLLVTGIAVTLITITLGKSYNGKSVSRQSSDNRGSSSSGNLAVIEESQNTHVSGGTQGNPVGESKISAGSVSAQDPDGTRSQTVSNDRPSSSLGKTGNNQRDGNRADSSKSRYDSSSTSENLGLKSYVPNSNQGRTVDTYSGSSESIEESSEYIQTSVNSHGASIGNHENSGSSQVSGNKRGESGSGNSDSVDNYNSRSNQSGLKDSLSSSIGPSGSKNGSRNIQESDNDKDGSNNRFDSSDISRSFGISGGSQASRNKQSGTNGQHSISHGSNEHKGSHPKSVGH